MRIPQSTVRSFNNDDEIWPSYNSDARSANGREKRACEETAIERGPNHSTEESTGGPASEAAAVAAKMMSDEDTKVRAADKMAMTDRGPKREGEQGQV